MAVDAADALHGDAEAVLDAWEPSDVGQSALRAAYLDHLRAHADAMVRTCRPAHLTASALILDPVGRRVLLTLHARIGRWLQTGGHCEPTDTTLRGAALREAREESGITDLRMVPAIARLDRHAVRCDGAAAEHLDVQFVALATPEAVEQRSAESLDLAWFPVDALPADTDASVRALVASGCALVGLSTDGGGAPGRGGTAAAQG